jgi:hypothetical protein
MTDNKDAKPAKDGGAAEVQKRTDAELEQGFRGVEADTTPNENYTVQGVTSGAPTPETDQAQADKVAADARATERNANGVAER